METPGDGQKCIWRGEPFKQAFERRLQGEEAKAKREKEGQLPRRKTVPVPPNWGCWLPQVTRARVLPKDPPSSRKGQTTGSSPPAMAYICPEIRREESFFC